MNVTFPIEEDASAAAAAPSVPLSSEDYLFVEARHPNTVLQGLNSLRLNNAFCDVTLCCGGQEFPCHRIVLASFSSYFQAMFSTDLIESKQERVAINGVEPQMIGMLVSYAYTSEVYISKANVQVSRLLPEKPFLKSPACGRQPAGCDGRPRRQMDEMNCVGIHCFVLEHIRLPLISPYYLHDVIESLDVVKDNQGCQRLISEAKDYLLLKDRRGELYCPRARPRRSTGEHARADTFVLTETKPRPIMTGVKTQCCHLLVGGAVLEDGDGTDLAQVYNPKTCMWTELAPMQIARSGSAACTLKGKLYVIEPQLNLRINLTGGWHASTENTDKVECYNPKTNQWTMCAPMKERRYRPGAAVVDGKIYVLGGEEGWDRYHDTIERYCDETDTWEIIGEMPTSRSWLSCVSLQLRKDIHMSSCPGTPNEN
uniref:BTB domain-containing protein n=1 Tax=Mola mola TaxID=94237 RepID=A0A3Q3WSV2_MOLML